MTDDTTDRLAEVEARVNAASDDIGVQYSIPANEWLLSCDKPTMQGLRHAHADLTYLLDRVRTLTAELARTKRGARTLGEVVTRQGHDVLDATGLHDWIDETGDGDWAAIWERLAELRPERDRLAEKVQRVEALADSWASIRYGGHSVRDDIEEGAMHDAATELRAALNPTPTEGADR